MCSAPIGVQYLFGLWGEKESSDDPINTSGERTRMSLKSMKPEQAEHVKRESSVVVVDVGCRS